MKTKWIGLAALGLLTAVSIGQACGDPLERAAAALASGRLQDSEAIQAIEAKLRSAGQDGMSAMANIRSLLADEVSAMQRPDAQPGALQAAKERLDRFDAAMDRVGGARYCSRSQLFWHTDFEAARTEAKNTGKPILSLRLLGKLTDEYSCANSRFFRTTLYANEEVSKLLRENFVLHWKSVRPVPIVTIDFGDGRKLQRTLTGNSIHYVLTPSGNVVDALPGLYGPKAFQSQLNDALAAAKQIESISPDGQSESLANYHREKLIRLETAWATDLATVARNTALSARINPLPTMPVSAKGNVNPPHALKAAQIAAPKRRIEARLIAEVAPAPFSPSDLDDEQTWAAIAALHAEDARLDSASKALIQSENPTAAQAGRLAITKAVVESPLVRMFRSFQGAIALDTVKNEYQLHRTIHQWLADTNYRPEVDELNERVYAELFLTPRSDPWLGLAPTDAYTALPNGGVENPTAARLK